MAVTLRKGKASESRLPDGRHEPAVRHAGRRSWYQLLAALAILAGAGFLSWQIVSGANSKSAYVPQSLSECQRQTPRDYQCYAKYYAVMTYDQGPKAAFVDMEREYNDDPFVKSECHQLAHIVGRTSYEKQGSLEKAYAEGDNFCWSGFYHGAIERAIVKMGDESIKKNTATICESFARKEPYSFNHFNCVHGLGHGLMAIAKYDLFNGLQLCKATKTTWEQESCYGGVFMENVMVASRGDGTSAYLDPARPLYPCTDVEQDFKQQCYLMQTSYILQHNGYDFAKTFQECAKADSGFTTTCYQSIGRDASGSTNSDVNRTLANCQQAPAGDTEAIRNCMFGAERDFVSYFHSDAQARQLCQAFGGEYVEECDADVTRYYSTF